MVEMLLREMQEIERYLKHIAAFEKDLACKSKPDFTTSGVQTKHGSDHMLLEDAVGSGLDCHSSDRPDRFSHNYRRESEC